MQKFDIFKTTNDNQYISVCNLGTSAEKKFIIQDEGNGKLSQLENPSQLEATSKLRSDANIYEPLQDFSNHLLNTATRTVVDTINGYQVFLDKATFKIMIDINGQVIPIEDNSVIPLLKESVANVKKIQMQVEGTGQNFFNLGDRVMAYGPTGTGKTYTFLQSVNTLITDGKLDAYYIATITEGFEDTDFFAYVTINSGGITTVEKSVVQLLRDAAAGKRVAICFDELNRGSKSFLNLVLKMLDAVNGDYYEIYYAANDEFIRIPIQNMLFFATMNLGGKYTGTNSLDEALFDRFNIVQCQSYNQDVENEIYKNFGAFSKEAKEIVEHTRKMNTSGEIRAPLSTRGLKAWAEKFINTSMQAKDLIGTFNLVALYRLCSVDDFGNPNKDEEMLILSKFKELKIIS